MHRTSPPCHPGISLVPRNARAAMSEPVQRLYIMAYSGLAWAHNDSLHLVSAIDKEAEDGWI